MLECNRTANFARKPKPVCDLQPRAARRGRAFKWEETVAAARLLMYAAFGGGRAVLAPTLGYGTSDSFGFRYSPLHWVMGKRRCAGCGGGPIATGLYEGPSRRAVLAPTLGYGTSDSFGF